MELVNEVKRERSLKSCDVLGEVDACRIRCRCRRSGFDRQTVLWSVPEEDLLERSYSIRRFVSQVSQVLFRTSRVSGSKDQLVRGRNSRAISQSSLTLKDQVSRTPLTQRSMTQPQLLSPAAIGDLHDDIT